jgi:hypothetical protein
MSQIFCFSRNKIEKKSLNSINLTLVEYLAS